MAIETSTCMLTHVLFEIEGLIMSEELRLVQLSFNQYMNVSIKNLVQLIVEELISTICT